MIDWIVFAIALAGFSTWNLAKCTLFAKEFERERIDHLLMKHGVSPAKLFAAEQTVREYRLRVVPVWLTAVFFSWLYLFFELAANSK